MRISVEKLVKKWIALNADPETRNSEKAKELKEFLDKNNYIESYKKHFELTNKILDLEMELAPHAKAIKVIVDFKTKK